MRGRNNYIYMSLLCTFYFILFLGGKKKKKKNYRVKNGTIEIF
jgi:hypothetical protein